MIPTIENEKNVELLTMLRMISEYKYDDQNSYNNFIETDILKKSPKLQSSKHKSSSRHEVKTRKQHNRSIYNERHKRLLELDIDDYQTLKSKEIESSFKSPASKEFNIDLIPKKIEKLISNRLNKEIESGDLINEIIVMISIKILGCNFK